MADITPIQSINPSAASAATTTTDQAANAFGLGFQDLLRIILTQLTYQDPLKPMDNFEFVSQLAQFSQIQQGQTMSDRLLGLLGQAVGLTLRNSIPMEMLLSRDIFRKNTGTGETILEFRK